MTEHANSKKPDPTDELHAEARKVQEELRKLLEEINELLDKTARIVVDENASGSAPKARD